MELWSFTGLHVGSSTQQSSPLEAQLQTTLHVIPAYTWYALPSGALVFVNERTADYLGLPKDHALRFGIDTDAAWDSHISLLHPDDREQARQVWSTCLSKGVGGELSFRVRSAEGKYRWFLSRAEGLRASDGTLLFWIGVNLDIDDAKRAEHALRKSEKELRDAIDTIPALVWSALPDGSNTYANKRFVEYLGLSAEHTAGSRWHALVHPDDLERHASKWMDAVATGKPHENESRYRRSDGQYRWHLDRGLPLRDEDGNIVKWYGVTADIEDRKRAEAALQQNQFYLAEGQRLAHMGCWAFNPSGGFEYWSQELFTIYGLDPQKGAPTLERYLATIHPQDRDFMANTIERMQAEQSGCDVTKRIVRPDGEQRHIRCVGIPFVEGEVLKGFLGTAIDVTEQELLTQKLERQQAHLTEAQKLTHTGSWAWRLPNRAVDLSEDWYRIYGFDPAEGAPTLEEYSERVHPEDRVKWKDAVERATLERVDYDHEFRILLPNGMVKWIHAVGHPVLTEAGDLEQFLGSSTDITDRKEAEQKLKEQEMELRQMLDFTPQLVGVFGPNHERLFANRMTLDYHGVQLEEWRRMSRGSLIHPDDSERAKSCWDRALASGSAYEVELRLRKGGGSYRWFLARYNPVRDDKGQVIRWYVACTDIDDRKRAEERLQQENAALREEIDKASMFEEIVGTSPALTTVLGHISKVAPSDSTVLIAGETGTGKELVARAIHRRSTRSSRPFVSVNCAAIPRELIASEMFGHEKGAFTGATQRRLGRFELADRGTIFLDEVGELLPDTQVALLRVLQELEFERVGGTQPIHVNVRVIAATNRNLEEAVANGTFRADLFYRLNVFPIEVPSLRERREDILMLVEYFVQRYATRAGKHLQSIEKKTLERLHSYDWPGNIRELQNVIERSVILSSSEVLSIDELWLSKGAAVPASRIEPQPTVKGEFEARSERQIIEAALAETRGRVSGPSGAAVRLGVPPSTLDHRIKALRIDKRRFKFA